MFKKLSRHAAVAFIFLFLTLGQQYLFYYVKNLPIIWLTPGKYFGIFAFLFAATFIRSFALKLWFLGFVFFLNFFQMAHLSYFGTQILPSEIYLLFTQMGEIKGTLLVEFEHVLIPLIFTLVPTLVGYKVLKKITDLYFTSVIGFLFIVYLIYNPVRTLVTGNTWGRQPSTRELTGMNVYLAFSYFTGRILPKKLFDHNNSEQSNSSTNLTLTPRKNASWDKIIFILGESLSPHHMSLYGYQQPTTPFLDSQKSNPDFFYTIGLAGGVSTDIAVAFLMNLGFGDGGSLKAAKGQQCLFKLAKTNHYSTHFLSAQNAEQLRYIIPYLCSSSLDDFRSLEQISPQTVDHQAADDKDLLPELKKLLALDSKQFIILHQRGSHAPWERRSTEMNRRFPHTDKIGYYNNSVVEFDLFMKGINAIAQTSNKKTLIIYVSDHGEAMGQDGKWGHGQLIKAAFEIPVIIMSFNHKLPDVVKKLPTFIPHYNLSLFMADSLGFEVNQPIHNQPKDYVIYGNDIDGFAGKAAISFTGDGTYDFKVIE